MKFRNIILAAVLPAAAFLAACGGDGGKEAPKPTVSFQTGGGYTFTNTDAYFDSSVTMGIRASSNDDKLSGVKVTLSTNGGATTTLWDTAFSSKVLNYDLKQKITGGVGDQLLYTVTATDKNGTTASVSLTISIIPATVAISTTSAQQVYNVLAPSGSYGAYDLYSSQGVASASSETVKDLKDMTPSSGANIAVFPSTWTSGNGSKFVKVTTNDWNNATSSDFLWNLWKTQGSSATTSSPALVAGDVLLVKTGQAIPFNIYIIKVTQVNVTPTPANGGDNNDYIKFDYKGLTK